MLEILLTQMRREGFEMTVSPPKVLYQKDAKGNKLEPIEEILSIMRKEMMLEYILIITGIIIARKLLLKEIRIIFL